jgi:PTS system nitrogen regulatory IIA component
VRLSLTEAIGYLGVSERTARRWIRDRGLPVHRADERLFVNPVELWEWAVEHNITVSPKLLEEARRMPDAVAPISSMLEAGGIHDRVPGNTPNEVLRAVVDRLPLPGSVDREFLTVALAGREAMGSTGIGHGIAIPHVRNPIVLQVNEPLVSLYLLAHPVDFGAIDGQPVHALFTLISPTVPMHLRMLAALSYLLQDPELRRLVQERATASRLLERMRALERAAQHPVEPRGSSGTGAHS